MYILVKMLSESSYGGRDYQPGKEYQLSEEVYRALSQACVKITAAKQRIIYNRILVVIDHGIGNIILKTPMLQKLRELYPQAVINVLVGRAVYMEVLKGLEFINQIYCKETIQQDNQYDLIINALPSGMSLIGIKGLIITGDQSWYIYGHEVDANMKILLSLGWDGVKAPDPKIAVEKVDFETGKYIGISAGYGEQAYWKIKNWGYKKFAALIKLLLIDYPGYKVLVFGKGKDHGVLDFVKDDRVIDCVDKYSIRQSAYLISICEFIVANDTGLGHIASAVGVRVYSIFGPTSRIKNRPYINGVVIARNDLDCMPCQFTHHWPGCKERTCMEITTKEVFNAINKKQKKKYRFGVLICTFDRYEFLLTTLNSFILCRNIEGVKFCIVDDGSRDEYVNAAIESFRNALPVSCELHIIQHEQNYGKEKYGETIREGVAALQDCSAVLFSPDDVIVNPWLFDVADHSMTLLDNNIRVISHMADERAVNGKYLKKQYRSIEKYNNFYDWVGHSDGFLCLIKSDTLAVVHYKNESASSGSGLWTVLNRQFNNNGWRQLRLRESLCFHFGNIKSRMNSNERLQNPIRSVKFNLIKKPAVLL